MVSKKKQVRDKIYVIILYFFYSLIGIMGKYNAMTSSFKSIRFFVLLGTQVLGLIIFTVLWQQILKKLELSVAYLFKGTTILWSMIFAKFIFEEIITINNIVGGTIVMIGIGVVMNE